MPIPEVPLRVKVYDPKYPIGEKCPDCDYGYMIVKTFRNRPCVPFRLTCSNALCPEPADATVIRELDSDGYPTGRVDVNVRSVV